MRLTDIRPPRIYRAFWRMWRPAALRCSIPGPWEHCLKDGRRIDVEIVSHRLEVAGRPAVLVVAQDVTERKRHQEEVERLNAQLRRAMTETHHRVKNNLQVISALVEMQALQDTQTVRVEELRRINQHILSLAAMHDLLTQQTKLSGDATSISAGVALHSLLPMLQGILQDAGWPPTCRTWFSRPSRRPRWRYSPMNWSAMRPSMGAGRLRLR